MSWWWGQCRAAAGGRLLAVGAVGVGGAGLVGVGGAGLVGVGGVVVLVGVEVVGEEVRRTRRRHVLDEPVAGDGRDRRDARREVEAEQVVVVHLRVAEEAPRRALVGVLDELARPRVGEAPAVALVGLERVEHDAHEGALQRAVGGDAGDLGAGARRGDPHAIGHLLPLLDALAREHDAAILVEDDDGHVGAEDEARVGGERGEELGLGQGADAQGLALLGGGAGGGEVLLGGDGGEAEVGVRVHALSVANQIPGPRNGRAIWRVSYYPLILTNINTPARLACLH